MENIFVEFLPPWIETGLQPAFYDKESGTVLQQTARMYARVNMLIRMFNKLSKNTKTTVEDYINQFNELHDYVHDYFDNLDVQEEINNKLDEMYDGGQLSDIIAQYIGLGALITFDTLSDLIASENLSKGSKCKTLGKETLGDGFGAYYEVDETGDIALDNGLYATLVPNFGGNNYYSYYNDITTVTERHYNTTCYITTIPVDDSRGDEIKPYIAQCNESPLRYAQKNNTSVTINASLGKHTLIHDGSVLVDRDSGNASLPDAARYLALTADRGLIDFQANTATAQNMINGGAIEAWLVFYKIISNGTFPDWDEIDAEWGDEGAHIATYRHPRQCIGIKYDKTIVILTTDGRRPNEYGLTSEECATILADLGCINAWNLDGGGSTSTAINGYKLNANIDNDYTSDREAIDACLNVSLPTIDKELADVNSYVGKAINENNGKLIKLINNTIITGSNGDVDPLIGLQTLRYHVQSSNAPSGAGYLQNYPISDPQLLGTYGKQIWYERARGRIYTRSMSESVFSSWRPSDGYKGYIYDRSQLYLPIEADDTYEKYTFANNEQTTINNSVAYLDFMSISDNDEVVFAGDIVKVLVTLEFDLHTTSAAGTRYVRAKEGTTVIPQSLSQWKDNAGTNTHTIKFICNANKPLSFEFYGKAGDTISRLRVCAESFD